MATQFGGGKTHSLTALYHLAKGSHAACNWKGVENILSRAQVPEVPPVSYTHLDVYKRQSQVNVGSK